MKSPETLQQAIVYFSDPERVFQYAVRLRWPDGKIICPRCESEKNSFVKTRRLWFCYGCQKQFTIKVGTIFEDSALGLDKWMTAVWMICNCKNGVSSYEIHRAIGVTQKTAWFMLHRIRKALQEGSFVKMGGSGSEVEVDETFIGGKARNMHVDKRERRITGTGGKDKSAVMGIAERGGKVRVMVVPSRKKGVLQQEVRNHVSAETALFTDALQSYDGLAQDYAHQVIDHAEKYVDGRVHTNTLENFWSLLKRSIGGTYVSVEPFHLHRYLDEQSFRYNYRATDANQINDAARFNLAMSQIVGKRLTYSDLTGKSESPHHGTTRTGIPL